MTKSAQDTSAHVAYVEVRGGVVYTAALHVENALYGAVRTGTYRVLARTHRHTQD